MSVGKCFRRGGRVEVDLDSKSCGVSGLADARMSKGVDVGTVVDVLVVGVLNGCRPGVRNGSCSTGRTETAVVQFALSFSFRNSPNVRGCEGDRRLSWRALSPSD